MNSFQTFNSNIRNEGGQRSLIFNKISKERYECRGAVKLRWNMLLL
jgi:hypothetical protein